MHKKIDSLDATLKLHLHFTLSTLKLDIKLKQNKKILKI